MIHVAHAHVSRPGKVRTTEVDRRAVHRNAIVFNRIKILYWLRLPHKSIWGDLNEFGQFSLYFQDPRKLFKQLVCANRTDQSISCLDNSVTNCFGPSIRYYQYLDLNRPCEFQQNLSLKQSYSYIWSDSSICGEGRSDTSRRGPWLAFKITVRDKLVLIKQTKQLIVNKMPLFGLAYITFFYLMTMSRNFHSKRR
jgi:hypothetical protein